MSRIDKLLSRAIEEIATSELLLQNGRRAASISRSYYAIFYATQAWLQSKNLQTKTHKGTIQLFSLHFVKTGEVDPELRQILQDAYTLRQISDYDEASDLSVEQATSFSMRLDRLSPKQNKRYVKSDCACGSVTITVVP